MTKLENNAYFCKKKAHNVCSLLNYSYLCNVNNQI